MVSKALQFEGIRPGHLAIINVGLTGPTFSVNRGLSPGITLARASSILREVLVPLKGEVYQSVEPEPVLIAQGVLQDNAAEFLWELCRQCNQDAVAIWYPQDNKGLVFGPYAEQWGEFHPDLFVLPFALRNTSLEN
jgi:hypothetical protein